jgi:hypothetical protein
LPQPAGAPVFCAICRATIAICFFAKKQIAMAAARRPQVFENQAAPVFKNLQRLAFKLV